MKITGGEGRRAQTLALLVSAMLWGCEEKAAPAVAPSVAPAQLARTREQPVVDAAAAVATDAAPALVEVAAAAVATQGHPTLVETLSAARCQRELRCGNLGAEEKHGSLARCREQMATSFREELNRYRCDADIVREGLMVCMQDIQRVDCAKPQVALKTVPSCKLSALCSSKR